jgi:hypothetical protein
VIEWKDIVKSIISRGISNVLTVNGFANAQNAEQKDCLIHIMIAK